jgi:membrane protein implicated in regulation of membrane protease activity
VSTFFLVCASIGGALLILQMLFGLAGMDHGELFGADLSDLHAGDALNLLSLRALAAGLAFFGLIGMLVLSTGGPAALALPAGLAAGLGSASAVALAQRQLRRLERDGTVRLENAVGEAATVYLSIPGGTAGPGKVHLDLQGRTVELQAVSQTPLPTGSSVVVVDVVGPDTVEVVPQLPPEV